MPSKRITSSKRNPSGIFRMCANPFIFTRFQGVAWSPEAPSGLLFRLCYNFGTSSRRKRETRAKTKPGPGVVEDAPREPSDTTFQEVICERLRPLSFTALTHIQPQRPFLNPSKKLTLTLLRTTPERKPDDLLFHALLGLPDRRPPEALFLKSRHPFATSFLPPGI